LNYKVEKWLVFKKAKNQFEGLFEIKLLLIK